MTDFTPGTKVHVEFDAIVEKPYGYDYIKAGSGGLNESGHGYGFLKVRDTTNSVYHYVWANPDDDLVTVVNTPDWEKYGGAQVGDIWEANGVEYFAYASYGDLTLYPVDGVSLTSSHSYFTSDHDGFGELNPRLVRRRGEDI